MFAPLPAAAALTAGLLAVLPAAPIRYKVDLTSKQVVDLTAFDQGSQETSVANSAFFALEVTPGTGGRTFTVTVDSLVPRGETATLTPKAVLDSARGAVYTVTVAANGAATAVAVSGAHPLAESFAISVAEFLPTVKGALAAGTTWSDTTENSRAVPGGALKVRTVSNYEAKGNGALAAAFASSQTGAQETPAGVADITGTAEGTMQWTLDAEGRVQSATRKETVKLSLALAAAPAPIPVTSTQEAVLTRLP